MRRRWRGRMLAGGFALVFPCPVLPADSSLSCEQLYAVAQSAVEFRDQGYSLQQVLAGLKGGELEAKLSADEIQVLRKAVTAVYLGNASAEEIALACRQARPDL